MWYNRVYPELMGAKSACSVFARPAGAYGRGASLNQRNLASSKFKEIGTFQLVKPQNFACGAM